MSRRQSSNQYSQGRTKNLSTKFRWSYNTVSCKEANSSFRIDQLRVVIRSGILKKKGRSTNMGQDKGNHGELLDGGTHFFLPLASDVSDAKERIFNTHWFLIAVGCLFRES